MEAPTQVEVILTDRFPYKLHQIASPTGEVIWIQQGINPDNIEEVNYVCRSAKAESRKH